MIIPKEIKTMETILKDSDIARFKDIYGRIN
jgi:hypothetical protein